jgi:hypothetical protein
LNPVQVRLHPKIECRGTQRRQRHSLEWIMTEDLAKKIVVWAAEIAGYAAQLPSRQVREAYLAERRGELVAGAVAEGATEGDAAILADACVNATRAIMTELLAHRAGVPKGRA